MAELAPWAACDTDSRGRIHAEPAPLHRGEFQRDRDRIIHCAAFRRLEYKTQVFVNHEGDMYRTRLTHSIEVAQIGRTIARALRLNEDLTEAIALAHDLGHTPFGHAGQDAVNDCMGEFGGFEHNLQSLRVVDALEEKYASFPGLNLTFETREGILKHCSPARAKKLGDVGARFLERGQPSLEAQIANLADEIAYNNHDVDDGLRSGLIDIEELSNVAIFQCHQAEVLAHWPQLPARRIVHETIRRMINYQVVDTIETSRKAIEESSPENIADVRRMPRALICFSEGAGHQHRELKHFLRQRLYRHYRVGRMSRKAKGILKALFEAFMEDEKLLPPDTQQRVSALQSRKGISGRARGVADYIAGMTDRYAIAEYERIFDVSRLT